MSHHLPTHNISHEYTLPNQPFSAWIRTQTDLFISQLAGIFSFISFFAALIYYVVSSRKEVREQIQVNITLQNFRVFIDFAHIWFIGIFIFVLIKFLGDNDAGSYRVGKVYERVFNQTLSDSELKSSSLEDSKDQLRKFKRYFLWFWLGMLGLYISFALKHILTDPNLAVDPNKPLLGGEVIINSFFPFLTFALNNLTLLFVFWCFTVLYLPSIDRRPQKRQKEYVYLSIFIIAVLTVSYLVPILIFYVHSGKFTQSDLTSWQIVFDGLSGALNAIALALLIARLDSKLIGLRSGLVSILYCYAAVQPLFVVFELPGETSDFIQTAVLIIVFIFKIHFFLIIIYILQTGRMLNYLFCFPTLNERVNSIFDNQFEIKTHKEKEHSFSFSITRKNADVYLSDITFKSLEECDKNIIELREIMKQESSYRIGEAAGTLWVNVVDSHDEEATIICRSVPLKSVDEASDLIKESMEKIPYCKYDRR